MSPTQRLQTGSAIVCVIAATAAHMLMSPPPSPVWVNLMVLAAVAVCAYTATGNALHNRGIRREDVAREQAAADRADAIRQAADCVITGRSDGPEGRPHPADSPSVTPAAVARYAASMGVTGVTLEEAADALRARLVHRGYASPEAFEPGAGA